MTTTVNESLQQRRRGPRKRFARTLDAVKAAPRAAKVPVSARTTEWVKRNASPLGTVHGFFGWARGALPDEPHLPLRSPTHRPCWLGSRQRPDAGGVCVLTRSRSYA
jgi:hypothetical protein